MCFSVCGASLYNWANDGCGVLLCCGKFMYREYDLIFEIGSFVLLVLFKNVWGRRVSPRFHLFVSDINQGNE